MCLARYCTHRFILLPQVWAFEGIRGLLEVVVLWFLRTGMGWRCPCTGTELIKKPFSIFTTQAVFLVTNPPFSGLLSMKIAEVNSSTWERCLQSSNFCLRIVGHEKLWIPIGVPCLQNLKSFFDVVNEFRLYNIHYTVSCVCTNTYEKQWQIILCCFISGIFIFHHQLLPWLLVYSEQTFWESSHSMVEFFSL